MTPLQWLKHWIFGVDYCRVLPGGRIQQVSWDNERAMCYNPCGDKVEILTFSKKMRDYLFGRTP